jgi:hypothetical protein
MTRTVEVYVDEHGVMHVLQPFDLPTPFRAILTIVDETAADDRARAGDAILARLAEASLAQDWNRPEEEAAWSHLKPAR